MGPAKDDKSARNAADADVPFRIFVETVRDYALIMLDTHGYIVSWNAGAEAIKGYTADEIIGQHFSALLSTRSHRARLARARARGGAVRSAVTKTRAGACARMARASGPTSSSPRCAAAAAT